MSGQERSIAYRGLTVLLVGLLAGPLGACAGNDYETFQPPPLDLSDRPRLRLAVDQVSVESAYRAVGAPPFVDHTLALTPEAAVRQLLEYRLQAVGGSGSVRAVILDASVREVPLEPRRGIAGYLTTEAAARFEGRVMVRVDLLNGAGEMISSISTAATRTRNLPEEIGYAERQRIGYELVRDLVNDLDAGLISNIEQSFGAAVAVLAPSGAAHGVEAGMRSTKGGSGTARQAETTTRRGGKSAGPVGRDRRRDRASA